MQRLKAWSEWLTKQFDLEITTITPNHEATAKLRYFHGTDLAKVRGLFVSGTHNIYIVDTQDERRMLTTLFHEFGHALVEWGFLSFRNQPFVRKYWRNVSRRWLLSYPAWEREEELVVQCFALWALDLTDEGAVNPEFKSFVLSVVDALKAERMLT